MPAHAPFANKRYVTVPLAVIPVEAIILAVSYADAPLVSVPVHEESVEASNTAVVVLELPIATAKSSQPLAGEGAWFLSPS
jgi:hypothetical protein